jgi:hypothetical protein
VCFSANILKQLAMRKKLPEITTSSSASTLFKLSVGLGTVGGGVEVGVGIGIGVGVGVGVEKGHTSFFP